MLTFEMQLVQKQLYLILYSLVLVLQEHANVDNLAFELQHVIQD